ncbi:zinc finger protein OZF-like isoform X2 [Agrilus planipennis]|uniref:Zinc finger protein OZF-like isoform X2 n=1 Tax=Agrilus planipennis TaxID=224129 RepID=A0A7F5R3S1_AGRPL|nr:zinc finger protein OZF-like isoform X2 [Agrilus planipennis]
MEKNSSTVCRTCLTERGQFISIFTEYKDEYIDSHFAEMLMSYTSLKISKGDDLPDNICENCANQVTNFYLFKRKCEESDRFLHANAKSVIAWNGMNDTIKLEYREENEVEDLKNNTFPLDNNKQFETSFVLKKTFAESNTKNLIESKNIIKKIKMRKEVSKEQKKTVINSKQRTFGEIKTCSNESLKVLNKFSCDTCQKEFRSYGLLVKHKKLHRQRWECKICRIRFVRNSMLKKHEASHAEIDNSKASTIEENNCLICNKVFNEKGTYDVHVTTHLELKEFECRICQKQLTDLTTFSQHASFHSSQKVHVCHICKKKFVKIDRFKNHMSIHSKNKRHFCKICSKGFNKPSNLEDHIRIHNGEKPYKCNICGRGFSQMGNLKQHTNRHTGIKDHLCSICDKGFASKKELSTHIQKHSGRNMDKGESTSCYDNYSLQ